MDLEDIAANNRLDMAELLEEMEMIVYSGTKLNIDYYLEENLDEYVVEDIYDYFMESETDSLDDALEELSDDDIDLQEIRLVRIKFISEIGRASCREREEIAKQQG